MNRKILARNSSICIDDTELDENQCTGNTCDEVNTQIEVDRDEVSSNYPDVVSDISTAPKAHDCLEDCNDPDVVRSNSSSDEKSIDTPVSYGRNVNQSKCFKVVFSSVSSFSSSSSSKQSSSSFPDQERKSRASTTSSFSSVDNDDELNEVHFTKTSSSKNCLFYQDSVFAQESESVFDQHQQHRTLQSTFTPRQIASSIMESEPSMNGTEEHITNMAESLERVQKARHRFSSSGYGTGSGESTKANSASKTSFHTSQDSFSERNTVRSPEYLPEKNTIRSQESIPERNTVRSQECLAEKITIRSQESIPERNTVRSQGTQTSPLDNEEQNCIENDATSTNGQACSTNGNTVFHPQVCSTNRNTVLHSGPQIQAKQGLGESSSEEKGCCNITSSTTLPASKCATINSDSTHFSQKGTYNSTAPSEQRTSELTKQNVSAENSPLQVEKQDHVPTQNLEQSERNDCDTAVKDQLCTSVRNRSQQEPSVIDEKSIDSQHNLSTSLQRHPIINSLSDKHFQTNSSSSGSCFIPSSVEEQWHAEPSHVSLAKLLLLQSGSESTEVSSRYRLESLIKSDVTSAQAVPAGPSQDACLLSAQNMPHFEELLSSSVSTLSSVMGSSHFDVSLMEKLQRSVRCQEADCEDIDCLQIKTAIEVVQNPRNHVDLLCDANKMMLLTMFSHTVDVCDHPKCPFPWCGEHIPNSDQLSLEQRLLAMKQRVENFAEHFLFQEYPRKYMKLQPELPYDSIPLECQDWVRLCMMGNSRRALLVQPVQLDLSGLSHDGQYWVIKKVSTTDDVDQWGVYSKLRNVSHKSVVTLLWAASFVDHMLVCSLYEGFTLNEHLPRFPWQQSRFVPVFNVVHQLTRAVSFLNNLGIAYLYWTSKNILVTYNSTVDFVIKLSNFSCSVLLESPDGKQPSYDGGHLLLALPRHIIAPELRDSTRVEYASDVWGLGCLLHELVTGYPIWHEHRHTQDGEFKLLTNGGPPVPDVCPELVDVFTACWEIDSSRRMQISDLERMMIDAFQVHLQS